MSDDGLGIFVMSEVKENRMHDQWLMLWTL
jgi:Ni,Fe-hydrogenase maturation factor